MPGAPVWNTAAASRPPTLTTPGTTWAPASRPRPLVITAPTTTLYAHMYDNGKTSGWDNLRTSTKTLSFTAPSTHYQMRIHWKVHV